ncbi:hypothetical protein ACHAWT_010112 [Skeletonema menzelii]
MFGLASGVYQNYFAPPKLSILIVGLDGAGKTALLERIKVTNITTQLDVSSQLPPTYCDGAVVFGSTDYLVATGNNGGATFNNGRKAVPARLPPPLPPAKEARGRKFVGKFAASSAQNHVVGESCREDEDENKINEVARLFITSDVPPPPFDMSSTQQSTLPPLPTNNNKRKDVNNYNPRGGRIMNMLRCPSPQKYTAAASGGEEDEYLDDQHDVAHSTAASSQSGNEQDVEEWDDEYLKDYHIDYNENQQFDIKNSKVKMFPLDKIRPTLGQNLAKLDMCGCKCSLFDLSGAEKMRPLWERYYRDADAIVYVVNCADTSFDNLEKSRSEFEQLCQNDVIERHCRAGLPIMIFANQIDLAYREYGDAADSVAKNGGANREVSWNADEEDNFVGGGNKGASPLEDNDTRALEFHDLAALFGLHKNVSSSSSSTSHHERVLFLFGGSAKSGEGVRASMEVLTAHAKRYNLARQARRRL